MTNSNKFFFSKTGEDGSSIWLSVLGEVYDVTEGRDYYGPGESYNKLASRDSSVPFVTGTFTPEEAEKDPGTNHAEVCHFFCRRAHIILVSAADA